VGPNKEMKKDYGPMIYGEIWESQFATCKSPKAWPLLSTKYSCNWDVEPPTHQPTEIQIIVFNHPNAA